MKFKVHLGEQAYNFNLGSSPFNLWMTSIDTTVVDEVTDYINAYLMSDSQIFNASDYGIDGFSKLNLESYWIDTYMAMTDDTEPSYGAPTKYTKVFYPEDPSYDWLMGEWGMLCDTVLYTGLGGILLESRLADGTSTYWKFSGAFSMDNLSYGDYLSFMSRYGDPDGRGTGADLHSYNAIIRFELLEDSSGTVPSAIANRSPLCTTYGRVYFGSTGNSLEYIGYEFMDSSSGELTSHNLDTGYLDFDMNRSRIHIVIPY